MDEKNMKDIEKENRKMKKEAEKKEKQQRKGSYASGPRKVRTGALKLLQHICITVFALAAIMLLSGSVVVIERSGGREVITQSPTDSGRKYEDSVLFNTILGYEARDVLRFVTIRSQLETNGSYDPDKVIDIIQYNVRQNENYDKTGDISVKYHLGDLLKWEKYGFVTESVPSKMLPASANAIFNPDGDNGGYSDMLVNRYASTEGLGLEDYATSQEEYEDLLDELYTCAGDLYMNYTEYLKLSEYFDSLNSNIRYAVVMGTGDDRVIYTNTGLAGNTSAKDLELTFSRYGKYLSYDSDRMLYKTNTAINESTFNSLISEYRYAYPDESLIYIGVDMNMPLNDAISQASRNYTPNIPGRDELVIAMIISVLFYIALLVLCTAKEGRCVDENGNVTIRFTGFDHTPIELWCVLLIIIIGAVIIGYAFISEADFGEEFIYGALEIRNTPYLYVVAGICAFALDICLLGLYYSLVRRIKGRHIWKQSLLYRLCCLVIKGAYSIYDNGNVLMRSIVPFGILIIFNLAVIVTAGRVPYPVINILILVAVDIAAGVFIFKQTNDRNDILVGMKRIIAGDLSYTSDPAKVHGDNRELSECVNSISDSVRNAVEQSMKDERMKTELVANVSHDIRTPLTSIINYVDLMKRENVENETLRSYIAVLDEKSQRLKTLTDDLIEASKVSSGNVELELVRINLPEMVSQALGEFDDRLADRNLSVVTRTDNLHNGTLLADGRNLWRVMENLLGNVCKYAMPSTRVFIDMFNIVPNIPGEQPKERIVMRITNMSEKPLPADLSELTERFIRGDESRTSEGSGLGLSIAKTLTELMGGSFALFSDADLFKAEISFEIAD